MTIKKIVLIIALDYIRFLTRLYFLLRFFFSLRFQYLLFLELLINETTLYEYITDFSKQTHFYLTFSMKVSFLRV